jgi:hypothetical protein
VDQLELEKLGIPTVTITTTEFASLARDTAFGQGAEPSFVVVPHPMGMISLAEIRQKAESVFPEILKAATDWQPVVKPTLLAKPAYPAEKLKLKGTVENINAIFLSRGLSLGIPIIPPTPELVGEMLKATSRRPEEVVGRVPPRMGVLTIELVATHAVMAGCKPSYMPLLISALEAFLDPIANWRGITTTTATSAAMVIVNGPIVKEIGLASGQGAAGKMHHANASIGYAINLALGIVGGSKPPTPDKSTLGGPADFVCWIFGENEDKLPAGWKPFHVDRGFKESDSVVTVMGIYPPVDNIDHWSITPEEHVNWWSHLVTPLLSIGGPCWITQMEQPHIIGLGAEHAQLVAGAGWTKDQFRKALWEKARIPFSAWPKGCPNTDLFLKKFGKVTPDTLVPFTFKPQDLHVIIAGGYGKHSHFFAPFPGCFPVSRMVQK